MSMIDSNGDEYNVLDTFLNTVPHYRNINKRAHNDFEEFKEFLLSLYCEDSEIYFDDAVNMILDKYEVYRKETEEEKNAKLQQQGAAKCIS